MADVICSMKLIYRIALVSVFAIFSQTLFSQTGLLKGIVYDSTKNEMLQGANVLLVGSVANDVTDIKGQFQIKGIKEGWYTITIRRAGYDLKTIDSIFVKAGETKDLGFVHLAITVQYFKPRTKRFVAPKTTVAAGVQDQKKNEQVTNVVTSESIGKTVDSDAAKVAARVPGVTLMENRFIMLRGLSQRYNSVQINNINAPSTEVDRRAFSFDLIPSSMLDKMSIFKSPSSDLAGDFAGGVIKLQTKSELEKDFVSYQFGLGYRMNTTFTNRLNNNVGSFTDFFGFDNGNRGLPSDFPKSLSDNTSAQNIKYGKTLRNNFALNEFRSPLDFSLGFGFGKNINIGEKMKLFTVNNFSYSTNYQFTSMKRYRYQFDQIEYVLQMFDYTDENLSIESKFSLLSNWVLKTSDKTTFMFRNIFNQIGENETTIRTGVNPTERPNDEWKNYSFHYTSRSLYFGQFEGNHTIGAKNKFVYTVGYSNIARNEPDYRRFRSVRAQGSNEAYTLVDPPSANLFDLARFYSKLNENTVSTNINYEMFFNNTFDSTKDLVIRFGTYNELKARTFDARWMSYKYSGDPSLKSEFLKTPFDQIFSAENINATSGLKPEEGTNPSDKYSAQNQLLTAYFNSSIPLDKFNFNVGVRGEYFNQALQSGTNNGKVDVVLTNFNILPSINASYNFNKKSLLRVAYGKTVNRPEFRELAPFVYYDFMYDVNIVGNPDLQSATIDNMDLRYEFYPSSAETVSFGLFYKRFLNPIENYVQPVGLSQQFFLKNASSATNMGAEIEIRKSFAKNTQNKYLKRMSAVLNASYILSEVDLGNDSTLSQARTRPLQGQSPYIINTALLYETDSGLSINLSYNIFGKRIIYVGNNIFPTVYEMPRHSLDFTISKQINKRLTLKFGVSDVLNYKHQLWQDTNADNIIDYKTERTDQQLLEFRRGQMFSLSFTYKIR